MFNKVLCNLFILKKIQSIVIVDIMDMFKQKYHLIYFFLNVIGVFLSLGCTGQDSLRNEKYLIIESTKFIGWQSQPIRKILTAGISVAIKKYNNDTIIRGKIDYLTDSSLVINKHSINLNKIEKIKIIAKKGMKMTTIGATTLFLSCGMMAFGNEFYPDIRNEEDEDINRYPRSYYMMGFACMGCSGGLLALTGIANMATNPYYKMDKNWKLYVKSKI